MVTSEARFPVWQKPLAHRAGVVVAPERPDVLPLFEADDWIVSSISIPPGGLDASAAEVGSRTASSSSSFR
jgi:hypothetical protein